MNSRKRKSVSISLDKEILRKIVTARGLMERSTWVESQLERVLSQEAEGALPEAMAAVAPRDPAAYPRRRGA